MVKNKYANDEKYINSLYTLKALCSSDWLLKFEMAFLETEDLHTQIKKNFSLHRLIKKK